MNKILEIGCGQGFYSSVLAKKSNTLVVGIDVSKSDIAVAKERYPHVEFQYMNAEKLKFPDKSFNAVYALDVLEHVDNLEKVIREVSRVLKRGGVFHINVPAEKSEHWLLSIRPTYFKEIHHVRIFSGNQMEDTLKKYNLKLHKKKYRDFLQHIELYYLFTRKRSSNSQLSIGDWRATLVSKLIHLVMLYFDPVVLTTPLKYLPLWVITLPIGYCINFIGNKVFPKSVYFEFIKSK